MDSLQLISFLLLIPLTLSTWSDWSEWSECSRTCDGGVAVQWRKCLQPSRKLCEGDQVRYQTCNHQACPADGADFRAEQCAAYNDVPIHGGYHKWKPKSNERDPCALTCGAEDIEYTIILAPKVLDGTRCNEHSKNMCVNGLCRKLGCDNVIDSDKQLDQCGVCGGNGSSCQAVTKKPELTNQIYSEGSHPLNPALDSVAVEESKSLHSSHIDVNSVDDGQMIGLSRLPLNDDVPLDEYANRLQRVVEVPYYEWEESYYSECSVTCDSGIQHTTVTCKDPKSKEVVPDHFCTTPKIPHRAKTCFQRPCSGKSYKTIPRQKREAWTYRWKTYEYGSCSHPCGGGIKTRQVTCVRDRGNNAGETKVPDQMCTAVQPARTKSCNLLNCPPMWVAREFSRCSASCGQGLKTRNVSCQQLLPPDRTVQVLNDAFCDPNVKPETIEPCDNAPCVYVPKIKADTSNYVQLQRRKVLRFVAGGTIRVIPGTVVRIRCPVTEFNKNDVVWTRSGRVLTRKGRVKRSRRGVLHIKGTEATDAGIYTCHASNASATTSLRIHSAEEALQKYLFRENLDARDPVFLDKFHQIIKTRNSRRKEEYTEPFLFRHFSKPEIPFKFITTDWGRCSSHCGGAGLQHRQITCEVNMDQYYLVVHDDICLDKGYDKPLSTQDCGYQLCPEWETGQWRDECTDDHCVDFETGARIRPLFCRSYNGTQLDHSMCDRKTKPREKMPCEMPTCIPKWTVSDWTPCSRTCGEGGIYTRSLQCVWESNNRPARGKCEALQKPEATMQCTKLPPCDDRYCIDESNYCSLVQMLNLCRYTEYRIKCCASCTAIGRGPIRMHRYRFT